MMEAYLVMINIDNNNNKYYHMKQNNSNEWVAEYGRVGGSSQKRTYSMDVWYDKYNEKLRKGYKDVTDLHREETVKSDFRETEDKTVNELMNKLMSFSKKFINRYYSVSDKSVTKTMVDEAQRQIGKMKNDIESRDVYQWEFNQWLSQLFTIIPRKMDKVEKYTAKSSDEYMEILEREQELLNVMQSSVSQNAKVESKEGKTVLEALNLDVRECTDKEMKQILRHVEDSLRGRVVRAFRVSNKTTEKKFDKFCEKNGYEDSDIKFLYHGSRNQNWYGILSEGLKLNPDAPITGKMFGYGNYFAPRLKKSMGYCSVKDSYWNNETSNVGYVAVYKVAMKNPKHVDKYTSEVGSATQRTMDKWGTDGVYAHKNAGFLYNDECIVYREEQSTIRYLLEIK